MRKVASTELRSPKQVTLVLCVVALHVSLRDAREMFNSHPESEQNCLFMVGLEFTPAARSALLRSETSKAYLMYQFWD